MTYLVKEVLYTLQGEGANAGRPAVFCRFSGCNLWTGREDQRRVAICQFCDTEFVGTDGAGGGRFAGAEHLASHVATFGPGVQPSGKTGAGRLVVCSGGEPLLQLDGPLVDALHARGFEIAIETNGTIALPTDVGAPIDWVCVSPKASTELAITGGEELKVIYPQAGAEPERYSALDFDHRFLQPMDGPDRERNTRAAISYCLANPEWRLSIQTHKYLGIP